MSGASASRAERVYLALVSEHQTDILNYLYRLVGDVDAAEDLTQDTYTKAWRALERLELEEAAEARRRAWLYRIAHNTALDFLRRKTRFRWLGLEALRGGGGDPAPEVLSASPVRQTLDRLGEEHRRVLLLFNYEGLSTVEVAEVLGISAAAARKRRQRAGEAFREIYQALETRPSRDDDEDEDGRDDDTPSNAGAGGGGRAFSAQTADGGSPPMSCERYEALFDEGPLRHLSPEDRVWVEAHLADCADCRARLATEQVLARDRGAERRLQPSRRLQQALLEVPRRDRRMRWLAPLMLPLAMGFCAFGSWLAWGLAPGAPRQADGAATATALAESQTEDATAPTAAAEGAEDPAPTGGATTPDAAGAGSVVDRRGTPLPSGASGPLPQASALVSPSLTPARLAIGSSATPPSQGSGGGSGASTPRPGARATATAVAATDTPAPPFAPETPEAGTGPAPETPSPTAVSTATPDDNRGAPAPDTPVPTIPGGGAPGPTVTSTSTGAPPDPAPPQEPSPTPVTPPLPTLAPGRPTGEPSAPPPTPTARPTTSLQPTVTAAPPTASPTASATITPTLTATPTAAFQSRRSEGSDGDAIHSSCTGAGHAAWIEQPWPRPADPRPLRSAADKAAAAMTGMRRRSALHARGSPTQPDQSRPGRRPCSPV